MRALTAVIDGQRGHLFVWSPVLFALGIGWYFALRQEPAGWVLWGSGGLAAMLVMSTLVVPASLRVYVFAPALIAAGFAVAGLRAHQVAAPVLDFRYYGPIEGRIVAVDRSASDAVRLTLDRVVLFDVPPQDTPERVRVSLHGVQDYLDPQPGQIIGMTGHLTPPSGPVEPGGFDFQRHVWFLSIGAVGYTRVPALELAPREAEGFWLTVTRLRMRVSAHVQSTLEGRTGAFAAAVTTGDRSGMDTGTLEALRASNLAHLLAISGLHMGLLTGFVFAALRMCLIMVPRVGQLWPMKEIAAVSAIAAGAIYLLLSGGNVATERAFIMVTVMFTAVLIGRRAVTLRAVAVAAMIVLALRPETLMGPGFQMSFAATTALVAIYGAMRDRDWSQSRWPKAVRYVGGVALSSAVAGAATAPFAAAHFNQVPHFGLIANMAAVPIMGAVVIPGAVLAGVLAPVGLEEVGFAMMAPAIDWILWVSGAVAALPGSISLVPSPSGWVLPLITLGGLAALLWRGRGRWAGIVPVIAAFVLWGNVERPDILVSDTGGLVGVLLDDGRALSKARGDGFAARSWLENDGDGGPQSAASDRWARFSEGAVKRADVDGFDVLAVSGKRASAEAAALCGSADIVIVNVRLERQDGCTIYDSARLRETGALAINVGPDGAEIVSARVRQGARLWSQ